MEFICMNIQFFLPLGECLPSPQLMRPAWRLAVLADVLEPRVLEVIPL
jgi:hypothetical protein